MTFIRFVVSGVGQCYLVVWSNIFFDWCFNTCVHQSDKHSVGLIGFLSAFCSVEAHFGRSSGFIVALISIARRQYGSIIQIVWPSRSVTSILHTSFIFSSRISTTCLRGRLVVIRRSVSFRLTIRSNDKTKIENFYRSFHLLLCPPLPFRFFISIVRAVFVPGNEQQSSKVKIFPKWCDNLCSEICFCRIFLATARFISIQSNIHNNLINIPRSSTAEIIKQSIIDFSNVFCFFAAFFLNRDSFLFSFRLVTCDDDEAGARMAVAIGQPATMTAHKPHHQSLRNVFVRWEKTASKSTYPIVAGD